MRTVHESKAYRAALGTIACALIERCASLGSLSGKRIFITGATGQLGSATVHLLNSLNQRLGLDIKIVAGARSFEKFEQRFSSIAGQVAFAQYDSLQEWSFNERIDYVVHCAGYGDPGAFVVDPVGVMKANVLGLDTMLSFLKDQGCGRLLFVSSGEVYGQGAADILAFNEDYCGYIDSMAPRSCYPLAKKAGETLCASYIKQHGVEAVVARQCHVFGPGYSQRDTRVTAEWLSAASRGQDVVMRTEGLQVRSYIYELDAACAYITLLLCGKSGEAYNVAPSYEVSIRSLAESIAQAANVGCRAEISGDIAGKGYGGITRSVLSPQKINRLGWREALSFDDAMEVTVKALREAM